uniref:Uncharacterized protein n=1 Tax=Tanacetum cinerariifolium TaxID=118510 RepID=A0A6L2LUF8_TANCI|nr:hypothetical protein [Tanacetum cinerariifolium]
MLPIQLTNDEIRNTKAYKEYYAFATGEAAPKPKASARRKKSGSDTSITPPTATTTPTTTVAVSPKLTAVVKGKQPAKAKSLSDPLEPGGSGTDEGTGSKPGVLDVPIDESEEELSWNSSHDDGADDQEKVSDDDEGNDSEEGEDDDDEDKNGDERDVDDQDQEVAKHDDKDDTEESEDVDKECESDEEDDNEETRDEESFDPISQTPESSEDESDGEEDQGLRISEEERLNEEEEAEAEELYIYQESSSVSSQFVTSMLNPPSDSALRQQRNLYKALVDTYEADKTILDSYGETVILKRRRDDDDDQDEGPSAGSDRGSKRRREGKEPESASTPSEPATRSAGRSTTGSKSRQASASESAFAEEPVLTTSQIKEPSHPVFETGAEDQPIIQSSQHPKWFSQPQKLLTPDHFSNFIMNRLRANTLTPDLLTGPTFELMKGSCTSLIKLEYHLEEVYKEKTDQLDWVNPEGASSCKYTTSVTKIKAADYRNIKWIKDLVPRTMWIQEPINYDKHALSGVSHWGRKHQQFYGFVINWESALDVYSKRRIIAKRLNLTKPDTYQSDLKGREAYTAYSNLRGFIYQNKDKKNRLMRIDKLYKFSDGMLNDVCNALDDRLKGIRM